MRPGVMSTIGGYGSLFKVPDGKYINPVLVSAAESAGEKLRFAIDHGYAEAAGKDLVSVCVNHVATLGAEPLFFMNALQFHTHNEELLEQIMRGISFTCSRSGCALLGGDTSLVPGLLKQSDFYLSGYCTGVAEQEKIIDPSRIQKDDVLIGLPSSGPHTTGFGQLHHILRDIMKLKPDNGYEYYGKKLLHMMMEPTRIYVPAVLKLAQEIQISGIINITEGGLLYNIPRMMPDGLSAYIGRYRIIPEFFDVIREGARLSGKKMYETFNMGIGMIIIIRPGDTAKAELCLESINEPFLRLDALDIQNLTKTYKNGVQALKGVSLKVARGDFFALLGPNGAGKSTMLSILSSTVRKTGGNIRICGHDLDSDSFHAKLSIGITPQEINMNIFEKSINVLITQAGYYGITGKAAHDRAAEMLKLLELYDKREAVVRSLSGGMKRRLMIARALMHRPEILILDEPSAGVDIEIRRLMWDFLRRINQEGTTIVLTTHYLEEAEQLCRNIAIIDRGKILTNTSVKALLASKYKKTFIIDTDSTAKLPESADGIIFRKTDEHTAEAVINDDDSLNRLFSILSSLGVEVKNMRGKTNRLEELFLSLTQKSA
ncbi:hypothetical protein CHS0354_002031 [Potamilus streckersoni]|uniref:phosphoribosylformylglycinamidine cyclo-ligase n=1 Tax=Potamilus streckersoni TaxID=2493646 RepID=A0AAE0T6R8_9BIVA|nr:hypothetical protein CHS0354_002031 [Potamilus streckersoni]